MEDSGVIEIVANSSIGIGPLLFIIGLGVNIPDHTTKEAERAMRSCARIYSIGQEPPSLWLPNGSNDDLNVVNLFSMYSEGAPRAENYERVAKTIIQSLRETTPVGYVTYGNPLAYDSVAQNLINYAKELDIPFRVVPGICSIDTLLCDLGLDMAPGIQICEASWLVAAQICLRTDLAAILLQIGAFGSFRTHYRTPPTSKSLASLVDYLTRFYSNSHRVFLVRSSNLPNRPGNVCALELQNLCNADQQNILNASMYIPASRESDLDEKIVERMENV
jgi:uncharacterized protein YabN with tetrapyrrole methylase and pyrophosphatase domain